MAGYDGFSMSNNARQAYRDGEMPMSKWTKTAIIDAVWEINQDDDLCDKLNKVSKDILAGYFLYNSSWHHTSCKFNRTDFHQIDEELADNLTDAKVNDLIDDTLKARQAARANKPKKSKEDRLAEQEEKEENEKEQLKLYKKLAIIEKSDVTGLKTWRGLVERYWKSEDGLDQVYADAVKVLLEKEEKRVSAWRQLPADHWRQAYVRLFDTNKDEYLFKELIKTVDKSKLKKLG